MADFLLQLVQIRGLTYLVVHWLMWVMLCFHKFIIGHARTIDYDKGEEFHWQIEYSPLHNIKRTWGYRYRNYNILLQCY